MHQEVKEFLDHTLAQKQQLPAKGAPVPVAAAALAEMETVEKDHGRLEIRRYFRSDRLDWFADRGRWEGLRSVGMVGASREVDGKTTLQGAIT